MVILLIAVVSVVSITAFSRPELIYRYNFNPYQVYHRNQWYRIFTATFLHAGWEHLFVNMFVLWSFGTAMVGYFSVYFPGNAIGYFLGLYLGGAFFSSLYTLFTQKNNYHYSAIGASGAVSAVVFCSIFFSPLSKIYFFAIIPIPGILFGGLYLAYSYYMSKRNIDNIGHDAHFFGAVFGFLYPMLFKPEFIHLFINQLFKLE
jgi:membrane associated rhomboid family serine protease